MNAVIACKHCMSRRPPAAARFVVVGSILCPSPLSSSQSEEGRRTQGNDDGHERYFDDLSE